MSAKGGNDLLTATLIATGRPSDDLAAGAVARLADAGLTAEVRWLDRGDAADLFFTGDDAAARAILEGAFPQVDVVVQPASGRRKRLLVADMDSTMITVECIDELADYAGLKAEVAAVTEAAMRGELDFEAALRRRVALLRGLPEDVIDRCRHERVSIMPGARPLVATMRAGGATCILVSGGFTRFADPVAAEIGFDRAVANVLAVADGALSGAVAPPIIGAAAKLATLRAESARLGLSPGETLAVGDGANDLEMIRAAGLGIAYRAKPVVASAAAARIDHNDLRALLWVQGIPRREWVGPSS